MFIKLNEVYGGEMVININHVWRVTQATGGNAKLWYSNNDADTETVKESFHEVNQMIQISTGKPIPDAFTAEMVREVGAY